MKKRSIPQDFTTISTVYATDNKAAKCTRQKLVALQREINKPTVIVGDSNTALLVIDGGRQKIS